ncbi:mCG17678, isoform CRA_b [Mus musculus]|nr:mCG17678, isoform CRA_b [Mus musculus]
MKASLPSITSKILRISLLNLSESSARTPFQLRLYHTWQPFACCFSCSGPAWDSNLLRPASGSHVWVRAWKASWNLEEKTESRRREKGWNQDNSLIRVQF